MGRLNIGLPKGQRGAFDYFYQSMRNAVPLIMQKNRLDFEKRSTDVRYKRALEQLRREADKAKMDVAIDSYNKTMDRRYGLLEKYFDLSAESENPEAMQSVLNKMQAEGMNTAGLKAFTKKGKSQSEMEMLLNMSDEKFNLLASRKKRLRKTDQPKNLPEAQYLMSLSDEEFEKFASRKKQTKAAAGENVPKELPIEKRAIEDRRRLEDDIQQVFTQLGGVEARQNITSAAMASQAPMVEKRKKTRLKQMLLNYEKQYGKQAALNRFGYTSEDIGIAGSLESDDPLGLKRKK